MSEGLAQLEARLATAQDHLERIRAQNALAEELVTSNPERALALGREALASATRLGAGPAMAESHFLLGHAHIAMSNYGEALEQAQAAHNLAMEHGDVKRQADCLQLIGIVHDGLSAFGEALEAFLAALRLRKDAGDLMGQAKTLNSIGIIHSKAADDATALEYYERSYQLHTELDDVQGAAIVLNNIGNARKNLGLHKEALQAFTASLVAFREAGNRRGEAGALSNLGIAYGQLGRLEEALEAFRDSLALLDELGNKLSQSEVLRNYGDLLSELERPEEAEAALLQALRLAQEIGAKLQNFRAHQALSAFYKAQDDPWKALEHFEAYHRLEREVFNEASGQKVKRMQLAFELEQTTKEREIFRLKHVELSQAHDELKSLNQKLEQQSHEDVLTRLFNRRYLDARLAEEFRRARRYGHSLSVAICDIDFFKQVNDRLSHAVGDVALRNLARIIMENVREVDIAARYGGEEFVIVFLDTPLESAVTACEKLRLTVEAYPWEQVHPELKITVSIGVCGDLTLENHEKMLNAADTKLYRAKEQGKNQVCW